MAEDGTGTEMRHLRRCVQPAREAPEAGDEPRRAVRWHEVRGPVAALAQEMRGLRHRHLARRPPSADRRERP